MKILMDGLLKSYTLELEWKFYLYNLGISIEVPAQVSSLWPSDMKIIESEKHYENTLFPGKAIHQITTWGDSVDALSVHAYIARITT